MLLSHLQVMWLAQSHMTKQKWGKRASRSHEISRLKWWKTLRPNDQKKPLRKATTVRVQLLCHSCVLSTFQKQRLGAASFFVYRGFKLPRNRMKNVFQTLYDVTNCACKPRLLKSILLFLSPEKPSQKSKQLHCGRLCRSVRAQSEFLTFNWRNRRTKKSNLVAGIMLEACVLRAERWKKNPMILFLHCG